MTQHVGVSGVYKQAIQKWVGVSGAWKAIAGQWVGVSGVWKKFFESFNIDAQTETWPGTAYIQFNTNGTIVTSTHAPFSVINWIGGAPITGIGTGVHIRMVRTSGYNSMPNDDTWLEITSDRQFAVSVLGVSDETWVGYVEYSLDGGTTVAATSAQIDITAQYIGP